MSFIPDPHERELARQAAITDAAVSQLVRALRPFGILRRDALSRECSQRGWEEAGFDTALAKAIATGVIVPLPGGFCKLAGR
jgi:hypothetical protein